MPTKWVVGHSSHRELGIFDISLRQSWGASLDHPRGPRFVVPRRFIARVPRNPGRSTRKPHCRDRTDAGARTQREFSGDVLRVALGEFLLAPRFHRKVDGEQRGMKDSSRVWEIFLLRSSLWTRGEREKWEGSWCRCACRRFSIYRRMKGNIVNRLVLSRFSLLFVTFCGFCLSWTVENDENGSERRRSVELLLSVKMSAFVDAIVAIESRWDKRALFFFARSMFLLGLK